MRPWKPLLLSWTKRKGSTVTDNKKGRPPLDKNEQTVRATVSMTGSQKEFLKSYGFGNISLGIQRLVNEKRAALPNEEGRV